MYKKLNDMLAECYLETKLQDEVAASLEVEDDSKEKEIEITD